MDLRSAYPGYPGAYSPAASVRRGSGSGDASPVDARLGGRFVQPHAFYGGVDAASSALKGLAKWHVSIPTVESKQPDGTAVRSPSPQSTPRAHHSMHRAGYALANPLL
jgi:hypothetical protein